MKIKNSYTGGILDGDGSIYFVKQKPDKTHLNFNYGPRVAITNSYLPLLKKINYQYKLGKIRHVKDSINKQIYEIKIASPSLIVKFLKQLLPHLIIKKKQAILMIQYFQQRKLCSNGLKGVRGFSKLTKKEILKREKFYHQMKILNAL